jgi:dTDP-4-amino-4,6-dideoxygalactose transaminase
MKFIDLERQYRRVQPRVEERIRTVLEHGKYILGPEVADFENQLGAYVGVDHAVGVANGTDALILALMALDVGSGDAVFVPSFTFFATAEAVRLVGGTPVFVDVDASTYNIDCDSLRDAIEGQKQLGELRLRGVISVDLFGLPADYVALAEIVEHHDLFLIEDGAQGFGGALEGRRVCGFGDIATTSFFPAKPLGCYGDGGAVLTSDDSLAARIRSLRVHGQGTDKYDNVNIGLNSRLDTIQAAILLEKLAIFDEELSLRNAVAAQYLQDLKGHYFVPEIPSGYESSWAQFTVRPKHGKREAIQARLKNAGIPTAVYYRKPLHLQPVFADLGYKHGSLPVSEQLAQEVFSLPMHPYLSDEEISRISEALLDA